MEIIEPKATPDPSAPFFAIVRHPLRFRLFLLTKLPAAFFSGVRVVHADALSCTVSVPYKRFTQNPFRSTYFACLSMAAEMSTGVLAMAQLYRHRPAISMLITAMQAKFHKKAVDATFFTCQDGDKIKETIRRSVTERTGQELQVYAVGKNKAGEVIAEFWFTWSFKAK